MWRKITHRDGSKLRADYASAERFARDRRILYGMDEALPVGWVRQGPIVYPACGHTRETFTAHETLPSGITIRHRLPERFEPRSDAAYWCLDCEQWIEPCATR